MPEKTRLFISDPCHEQWGHMQPDANGRFCASCSKTVVDFTTMNDQEVLSWLSKAGKSVCGRFMDDQLNRDISPVRPPKKNPWVVWNFFLAGLLVSSEASAQVKASPPATNQSGIAKGEELQGTLGSVTLGIPIRPAYIAARIVDSATGRPVSWASIHLGKDKKKELAADKEGKFSIDAKLVNRALALDITAIGYEPRTLVVNKSWMDGQEWTIELIRAATELPPVTVVSNRTVVGKLTTICTQTVTVKDIVRDTLTFLGLAPNPLTVYPNPVAKGAAVTVSVKAPRPGNYMVQLFSSGGALVESLRMEGVDGAKTELLDISETIAAGLYFVRLTHEETGKVYTQKVMVL